MTKALRASDNDASRQHFRRYFL